jgi:hypothetical protein
VVSAAAARVARSATIKVSCMMMTVVMKDFDGSWEEDRVRNVFVYGVGRVVEECLLILHVRPLRYILIYTYPYHSSNPIPLGFPLPGIKSKHPKQAICAISNIQLAVSPSPVPVLLTSGPGLESETPSAFQSTPQQPSAMRLMLSVPCGWAEVAPEHYWLTTPFAWFNSAVPVSRGWNGRRECDSLGKVFDRGMCYIGEIDEPCPWLARTKACRDLAANYCASIKLVDACRCLVSM